MSSPSPRRILIVEPTGAPANVFSGFPLPLLGPLYLGTLLARAGFGVRVVCENLLGRPLGPTDLDVDDLLLSCLTPTVERGYELAATFKRLNPKGRVIMGGPHVSFLADEARPYADHVVVGEGENVIVDLIRDGAREYVVRGTPVTDLDALPLIDWGLLANGERLRIQPAMGSRGCPFGCNFCSVTAMFGRCYRTMSVPRLLEEYDRASLPDIFFYDDNFAANRKRTHEFVDGILARPRGGKRPAWSAQVRADVTRDRDLVAKMAAAGCSRVYVGFESVNDASLKEMKKGQTSEDVRRAIRTFHEAGIHVHGMFIFGVDADDPASLRATSRFVHEEDVDSVQYMIFTPLPGTEAFRRIESENRLLHRLWRYYDGMHVVFRPRNMTPLALQRLALESYADYYSLLLALNEGLETATASLFRLVGGAPRWLGLPSFGNAGLRLLGARIVRRWNRLNADYLEYLAALS